MNKGKVYCSADWHGNELGFKVLDFLKPEDTLYFLGDAIDRDIHGIALLDKLLADPRVIFIKGNHEEMMAEFLRDTLVYHKGQYIDIYDSLLNSHWFRNGGGYTWEGGLKDKTKEEQLEYCQKINALPLEKIYISPNGHTVILEHAGYTPSNHIYRNKKHNSLWDRGHFHDAWEINHDNIYLVHGHTPVQYLKYSYGYESQEPMTKEDLKHKYYFNHGKLAEVPTVIRYCDNHKFDIDMCTVATNRIALLDLDTFETIYFDKGED